MPRRDRRNDIMRAAEKLFTSRRYHDISLDDVVQEAKVGKGTIYRYFEGKDDLLLQTASSGFEELCEVLAEVQGEATFGQRLRLACTNIGGFYTRRRQLLRMMESEEARVSREHGEGYARWMEQRERLLAAAAGIIRSGIEEGCVRGDVRPEVLAGYLLGLLRTRAGEEGEKTGEYGSIEMVTELFCHGALLRPCSAEASQGYAGQAMVRQGVEMVLESGGAD